MIDTHLDTAKDGLPERMKPEVVPPIEHRHPVDTAPPVWLGGVLEGVFPVVALLFVALIAPAFLQKWLWMREIDYAGIFWTCSPAVSGVDQARNQLEAAQKLVKLALQVVQMQRQKFTQAVATVEEYITAQQNLRSHVAMS